MRRRSYLVLLFGLMAASPIHAATCYVNTAATGFNNGTSWTDAYTDLQSRNGDGGS